MLNIGEMSFNTPRTPMNPPSPVGNAWGITVAVAVAPAHSLAVAEVHCYAHGGELRVLLRCAGMTTHSVTVGACGGAGERRIPSHDVG